MTCKSKPISLFLFSIKWYFHDVHQIRKYVIAIFDNPFTLKYIILLSIICCNMFHSFVDKILESISDLTIISFLLSSKSNWPISNGYRTNIILFISNKKSIRKHMSWTKLLHTHCDKEKIPSSNNPTLMKKWKWVLTLIYFTGFPRKRNYVLGWRNTNDSMIL